MINPEHLAAAARVAEVQPYPTQLIVRENGILISAAKGPITCEHLVPWIDFADAVAPAEATGAAFRAVREAMATAEAEAPPAA